MKQSKKRGKRKAFIVDTNVMMHDPNCLRAFEENAVIVPIYAIQELDKHKNDTGVCGANARAVSRFLEQCTRNADPTQGVTMENGGTLYIDYNGLNFSSLPVGLQENNDMRMLLVAMRWKEAPPIPVDEVWLISKDTNLVITARVCGINASDYTHDKLIKSASELYSGFAEIVMPKSTISREELTLANKCGAIDATLVARAMDLEPLLPNTCCLFTVNGKTFPAIFKKRQQLFRIIKRSPNTTSERKKEVRARNLEQIFAYALLTDPEISIITLIGKSGTGKTLMALLAGWEQLGKQFNQMLVYRPNIPLGRDLGYLPGDIKEKFEPFTWPIVDNMNLIVGRTARTQKKLPKQERTKRQGGDSVEAVQPQSLGLKQLIDQDFLRIDPTTYIRGRSVHGVAMIVDETQNLTPHETKTVVTRAGHRTKVIMTGDIYQIDNPYVDVISNGLTHVTERLKGQERFGHITMHKGERSELAELAADLL